MKLDDIKIIKSGRPRDVPIYRIYYTDHLVIWHTFEVIGECNVWLALHNEHSMIKCGRYVMEDMNEY